MVAALLFDKLIIEAVKQGELVIEAPDGRKLIDPRTGQLATGPDLPSPGLDAHRYVLHARRVCSWRANTESPWIDLESKDFVMYSLRHMSGLLFPAKYVALYMAWLGSLCSVFPSCRPQQCTPDGEWVRTGLSLYG
jgi:hypothetical protein